MTTARRVVAPFERWAPLGFVLGGLGILGTSVVGSLDVAGTIHSPGWLAMGPLLVGLWFAFVGMVGVAGSLRSRSPRLGTAGALTAGIGWVVWTATLAVAVGVDLASGRTFADPGPWAPPLLVLAFVLALLSSLVLGVAGLRTGVPSPRVGALLLVPVLGFLGQALLLGSKILTGDVAAVAQLALGAIIAVALLLVGVALRGASTEGPDVAEGPPAAG